MAGQPELTNKLTAFVDDLDATIRDVRKTIFSLQEPTDRPSGLRREILRVVTAAADPLGFEPRLDLQGPLDSAVPAPLHPDLLAVLGEALTNVARHAQATKATVQVGVDLTAHTVTLEVTDDGRGPGPADVPDHGTVNMTARARRWGGGCQLGPTITGGARLVWSIPLDSSS